MSEKWGFSEQLPPATPEKETNTLFTLEDRDSLRLHGETRRTQLDFKKDVAQMPTPDAPESVVNVHSANLEQVYKNVSGDFSAYQYEQLSEDRARELHDTYDEKARVYADTAPNVSAHNSALKLALLYSRAKEEGEYLLALQETKDAIARASHIKKRSPIALNPESIVLGIQSRRTNETPLPAVDNLTEGFLDDESLLPDIAAALDEQGRQAFIASLPSDRQARVSATFDHIASEYVQFPFAKTTSEKEQHFAIIDRVQQAVKYTLTEPKEGLGFIPIKTLCETLANLDTVDAPRILQELGQFAIAGDAKKEDKPLKLAYAARIVKTLSEIDRDKGGNLTMKLLAKSGVPKGMFTYFCKNLIDSKYFTANATGYLDQEENLPFLRKLIAENPNQFNTILDTLSDPLLKDYPLAGHEDEIFSAVKTLGSLTPIIFNRYRHADVQGKRELVSQLKELKPKFFQNTPIKDILPKKDREILDEMVYLAYNPIGMSSEDVTKMIEKLDDQTGDLEDYIFPENGYEFALGKGQSFRLKEGMQLDMKHIREWNSYFNKPVPADEKDQKEVVDVLKDILKGVTGDVLSPAQYASFMSIMGNLDFVQRFKDRHKEVSEEQSYSFLNDAKEMLGIYFKDEYGKALHSYFSEDGQGFEQISHILDDPKKGIQRKELLKRQLGKEVSGTIDWDNLSSPDELARLITKVIQYKILPTKQINSEIKKFEASKEGAVVNTEEKKLKAYISKNIGSFFAKASAGICTSGDIPLFERDDHFHINIVENDEQVRGNIQAYIIKEGKDRSLVLRGFNPNVDFIDKVDVRQFVEHVIDIGQTFANDNNLSHVYITEQGSWHALSNREKVGEYLIKNYHKKDQSKDYSLKVASSHTVNRIYQVR